MVTVRNRRILYLQRYTNLPSVLHILQEKCLTLLSPNNWDDRNDAFYIEEFRHRINAKSVLALCFSESKQTYHHWRVFAAGSDGVCMEFNKTKLLGEIESDKEFIHRSIEYRTLKLAEKFRIKKKDIPFVKRRQYKAEKEYRILFIDSNEKMESHRMDIPLDCINRITLNPWMPKSLSDTVRSTLKGIKGCDKIRVNRSTIIDNESWKRAVDSNPK